MIFAERRDGPIRVEVPTRRRAPGFDLDDGQIDLPALSRNGAFEAGIDPSNRHSAAPFPSEMFSRRTGDRQADSSKIAPPAAL